MDGKLSRLAIPVEFENSQPIGLRHGYGVVAAPSYSRSFFIEVKALRFSSVTNDKPTLESLFGPAFGLLIQYFDQDTSGLKPRVFQFTLKSPRAT
jgi:hypothetical protein